MIIFVKFTLVAEMRDTSKVRDGLRAVGQTLGESELEVMIREPRQWRQQIEGC